MGGTSDVGTGEAFATGVFEGITTAAEFVGEGIFVGIAGIGSLMGVGRIVRVGSGVTGGTGAYPVGVIYVPQIDGAGLQAPKTREITIRIRRVCFTIGCRQDNTY